MMWRTWSTFTSICGGSGGMTITSGCVCTRMRVSRLSASRRFSRTSTASAKRSSSASASPMRIQLAQMPQKSGRPSVTGCCWQFIAFATICASVNLPEPCGPDRITECGKCPRASISRMVCTTSGLPWKSANAIGVPHPFGVASTPVLRCAAFIQQTLAYDSHDFGVYHFGWTARIHHRDPLRFALGNRAESLLHARKERVTLLLEAVLVGERSVGRDLVTASRPLHAVLDIGVHQNGEVRPQAATQYLVKLQHRVATQMSSSALVCFGGIGEAVAEHPLAAIERRFDDLRELLCAGGEHQRHLCHRVETCSARIQQHSANALANLGSARLAGG